MSWISGAMPPQPESVVRRRTIAPSPNVPSLLLLTSIAADGNVKAWDGNKGRTSGDVFEAEGQLSAGKVPAPEPLRLGLATHFLL
jgi:hypothetical protein